MPNWVMNIVEIQSSKDVFDAVAEFVKGEEEAFDFNKIIPMPDTVFKGNIGTEEREKYGEDNWYDWSIKNWGCKWNASDVMVDEDSQTFAFTTPWSAPIKIIEAFAKIVPDMSFVWTFADEDRGNNTGKVLCEDGELFGGYDPDGSSDALENYAYCWGDEDIEEEYDEDISEEERDASCIYPEDKALYDSD